MILFEYMRSSFAMKILTVASEVTTLGIAHGTWNVPGDLLSWLRVVGLTSWTSGEDRWRS